jgi:hypothetical protein
VGDGLPLVKRELDLISLTLDEKTTNLDKKCTKELERIVYIYEGRILEHLDGMFRAPWSKRE